MSGLTRVPVSLVSNSFPVRWIGTEAKRLALTGLKDVDLKYFFLQKAEGKPNRLFALEAVTPDVAWQEISVNITSLDEVPVIKTEIDALKTGVSNADAKADTKAPSNFTSLPKVEDANVAATTPLLTNTAEGNAATVTLQQIQDFVASKADKHYKGFFADPEKLNAGVTTPTDGNYAIVGTTDSVWVWDTDTSKWIDTRVTGVVDASRRVIAGTGLTGGGALTEDVTLTVAYGTTASTACEGNDVRLEKEFKWSGTADERLAMTVASFSATDIGKIYTQTADAVDGKPVSELFMLTAIDPTPAWTQVGGVKEKKEPITTQSGTVSAGSNKITITKEGFDSTKYYLEVFLSGIHQMKSSWSVADNVITLGGSVLQDIDYDVILYPLG